MSTLMLNRGSETLASDSAGKCRSDVSDILLLLTHPIYSDESLTTLRRMALDIEAHLRNVLVTPVSSRLVTIFNRSSAFLRHQVLCSKKSVVCNCGRVLLKHGVCRDCFEHELEVLRQMRPEMEAAIEAAKHLGYENKQLEAHLVAFNAKVPHVLRWAVEQALKKWIFEVLSVHVQIWESDIPSEGFSRQTLKISKIAVPSEGLRFIALLMANNDKLPRRTVRPYTPPWVHAKGLDPFLVYPFDVGVMCGKNAIQVAVCKWD